MMSVTPTQASVIYQLHPNAAESMKGVRDQLYESCGKYLNRPIRVKTMDGHVYEGTLVSLDGGHLYLKVSPQTTMPRSASRLQSPLPALLPLLPFLLLLQYHPSPCTV